jgi:hypothetical protein
LKSAAAKATEVIAAVCKVKNLKPRQSIDLTLLYNCVNTSKLAQYPGKIHSIFTARTYATHNTVTVFPCRAPIDRPVRAISTVPR